MRSLAPLSIGKGLGHPAKGSSLSWFMTLVLPYTGSVYCDHDMMLSGMIGEGVDSSSVLVVKTHDTKVQEYIHLA